MYKETKLSEVRITEGLLAQKRRLAADKTIPHIWAALHNEVDGAPHSGAVENFRIAAGESAGDFYGLVSQDSDLYKWMEAAALSLPLCEEEGSFARTAGQLAEMIALLERARQKDGYLNTYYITHGLKDRWNYLKESCQLYCAGHLLEAAVSHYEVTEETGLLEIAKQYADCIDHYFGSAPGKVPGYDGHAGIELALYRLYGITGMERYRELADYFVEERGQQPGFFAQEKRNRAVAGSLVYELEEADFRHSQSHRPLREQTEAVGHAVKAMYLYTAATEKARLHSDDALWQVMKRLWNSVTNEKMYLIGAIGSAEHGESFTAPYDLPPDLMYGETCAAIGLFLWAWRMLLYAPEGDYADVMERALYNGILAGMGESGTAFFYTNALEIDPGRCENRTEYRHLLTGRQSWFACPCCPPNIARLLLGLNRYLYTADEADLYVHHFTGSKAALSGWLIEQQTRYPETGKVILKVRRQKAGGGLVRIRRPGWCLAWTVTINGQPVLPEVHKGYWLIRQTGWQEETKIEIDMHMPPVKVYAHPRVKSLLGRAAVMRGPLVYCAEEIDNGEVASLFFKENGDLTEKDGVILAEGGRFTGGHSTDGQVPLYDTVKPKTMAATVKLIPYYRWNNRGPGGMKVFLEERQGTDES